MPWLCYKWNILIRQSGTARIYYTSFSCKGWTSTRIVRLDWKKLWLYPKWRYDANLHYPNKRMVPDFWMVWRYYSILHFHFFYLEPTARKDIWTKETSFTVTVIFWKNHIESYLMTAMLEVCPHQLQAKLASAFLKMPWNYSWRFHRHGLTYMLIFLGQLSWN